MQLTTVLALLPLLASTSLDVPVRASADPMRKLLAIVPTQPSTHNLSSPSPSYQTSAKVANTGSAADSSSAANTSSANTSSAVSACGKDNQPACRADPPKHMLPYCTEPGELPPGNFPNAMRLRTRYLPMWSPIYYVLSL